MPNYIASFTDAKRLREHSGTPSVVLGIISAKSYAKARTWLAEALCSRGFPDGLMPDNAVSMILYEGIGYAHVSLVGSLDRMSRKHENFMRRAFGIPKQKPTRKAK